MRDRAVVVADLVLFNKVSNRHALRILSLPHTNLLILLVNAIKHANVLIDVMSQASMPREILLHPGTGLGAQDVTSKEAGFEDAAQRSVCL